jgi:uncharacterized protein (DUF58 family)
VLTRQGWLVGLGAALLLLGGRILGLFEVFALGVIATTLLIGSAVLVRAARLELEVGRVVHPARVHVGQRSRVDLSVRNTRGRRTPVLRLRDPVSGTRGADLLVPPLASAERSVAAYRLPTERRGIVRIGPLDVVVTDPFGLVDLATAGAPEVQLTVLPHIDPVAPLPYTSAHDPQAGIRQLNSLGRTGEEFYALRPFTVGDDLRRVHWPSSARLDELMVRQNELPWQGRTTVLLDVRDAAHHGDSIEVAVSAAASIVAATARRQELVRRVTTGGSDSAPSSRSWPRCPPRTSGPCRCSAPATAPSPSCRSSARPGIRPHRPPAPPPPVSSASPATRPSRSPGTSTSAACPTAAPAPERPGERAKRAPGAQ